MTKKLNEIKTNALIQKAQQDAVALNQMYQAGFLDGFNCVSFKQKKFKSLKKKCFKAFSKRFKEVVQIDDTDLKGDKGKSAVK